MGAGEIRALARQAGIAPGVSLFNARVFCDETTGASQADIANALDELSRNRRVDLVNLSLGATSPSQIELDAIRDALERGTHVRNRVDGLVVDRRQAAHIAQAEHVLQCERLRPS